MLTLDRPRGLFAHSRAAAFRPTAAGQPALMAAGVAAVGVLLAAALVLRAARDGVTFAAFASYLVAAVLLAVAALVGYWALALANLRYELEDGALVIVWGLTRQVIPLANMERVVRGRSQGVPRVQGLELTGWPCHVGRAWVPRLQQVLMYSTHRTPADILYLVTVHGTYGLSPANPQGFIRALQRAIERGADGPHRQEVLRHPLALLPLWSDRAALAGMGLLFVLALAAVGIVFARYTAIPRETVLPFPEGNPATDKGALLGIPLAALALAALDIGGVVALHRSLRPIAYALLAGGIFVQALFLISALLAT